MESVLLPLAISWGGACKGTQKVLCVPSFDIVLYQSKRCVERFFIWLPNAVKLDRHSIALQFKCSL